MPEFVTQQEEQALLAAVNSAPAKRWVQASGRSMQNWGGRPSERAIREVSFPELFGKVALASRQLAMALRRGLFSTGASI